MDVEVEAEPSREITVGGLVGLLKGSGGHFIMNSYSKGSVSINGDLGEVGGLVGFLSNSSLHNTYSHSRVSGGGRLGSGGLIGQFLGEEEISIHSSYSLGKGSPDDPLFVVIARTFNSLSNLFWDSDTGL